MFKLSEKFGQRGGSDAFGRRAVKNIGIRTDIGQTFAETGTTSQHPSLHQIQELGKADAGSDLGES